LRDCIEIFEEYGWDYTYNTFRTWDGWSVEHSTGWYDSVLPATKTDRELLFRSYFAQNNTTAIQQFEKETGYSICYPNHVKDVAIFHLENLDLKSGSITIFDAQGRLIILHKITNNMNIKIDISSIRNGLYFYTLTNENTKMIVSGKFIKANF
jgi:hypothetical protein